MGLQRGHSQALVKWVSEGASLQLLATTIAVSKSLLVSSVTMALVAGHMAERSTCQKQQHTGQDICCQGIACATFLRRSQHGHVLLSQLVPLGTCASGTGRSLQVP